MKCSRVLKRSELVIRTVESESIETFKLTFNKSVLYFWNQYYEFSTHDSTMISTIQSRLFGILSIIV